MEGGNLNSMFKGLGRGVYKARWIIVIVWLLAIGFGGMNASGLDDVLSGGGYQVSGSMAKQANELLSKEFAGRSETSLTLLVRDPDHEAGTPEYNDKLQQLITRLKTEEGVSSVLSLLDASSDIGQGMIGKDKHVSIAFVDMSIESDYLRKKMPDYQERLKAQANSLNIQAHLLGSAAYAGESDKLSDEGLGRAELMAFPLVLIVLVFAYRSVAATLTSLFVTIAAVILAMGIIKGVANHVELSSFVTSSAMMLGLGVGIDYSLFIVSRFKKELESKNTVEAVVRTVQTAGHTVLFSAITVIAALSALFIVDMPVIKSIALGGIVVVIVTGLVSITLMPALLSILGKNINKFQIPLPKRSDQTSSGWQKWTYMVMKRPFVFLILSVGLLLLFAAPALNMKLYSPDFRVLPENNELRHGFETLEESFGKGVTSPVNIVLTNDKQQLDTSDAYAKIVELQEQLKLEEHVDAVTSVASFLPGVPSSTAAEVLQNGSNNLPTDVQKMLGRFLSNNKHVAVLEVKLDSYGSSDTSREFVKKLRDHILPNFQFNDGTTFLIGGETMSGIQSSHEVNKSLFPALAIMLGLIYVILLITFRSILLPLKAIILNLISVSATYGILVFVFAEGHGSSIFGVATNGYIILFVPLLLMALLFGLSTDYEVFLVSRIKEEYDDTRQHEQSIATGMEKTGPLITGAALLMLAVFFGFAFSGSLPIQMIGFGMAVAIALDATIIRMVLVPVTMKILGRFSWWYPGQGRSHMDKNRGSAAASIEKPIKH
ncbi:MMPL family transporter [Paenibacillus terricola]|nr:MMPL family transporter [Paenibacillus terricola]